MSPLIASDVCDDGPEAHRGVRVAALAIAIDGESVVLEPQSLVCVPCGSHEHVIPFHGKGICLECVREVRDLASGG